MAKTFKQFRLDNVTATLPTTLEYGEEVYYTDANGNLTLWVGHSDGTAWPVCGYKEYSALLLQSGTGAPVASVRCNTLGTVAWSRTGVGAYNGTSSSLFTENKTDVLPQFAYTSLPFADDFTVISQRVSANIVGVTTQFGTTGTPTDDGLNPFYISIRVYP